MTKQHTHVIIAALDSSEIAPLVLEHAFAQASGHPSVELHVLGVIDTGRHFLRRERAPSDELEKTELQLRLLIEEEISNFDRADQELAVRVHARAGVPDEQIVELAAEARAHLIVMGRHGERGHRRFLVGSVPERVTRAARCPVLIAQVPDYDGEEASETQCNRCVTTRRDSNGERWFCPEHTTEIPWRSSSLRISAGMPMRDQGLWF
jgi:nucleotide-binding universal stress UspA family protein